jgi:hypothetical protein
MTQCNGHVFCMGESTISMRASEIKMSNKLTLGRPSEGRYTED